MSSTRQKGSISNRKPCWRLSIRYKDVEIPLVAVVLILLGVMVGGVGVYYLYLKGIFEREIEIRVQATVVAWPTATPVPTYTPYPTSTPCPACAPCPTCTPVPTPSPTPMPSVEGSYGRIRTKHTTFVTLVNDPLWGGWVLKSATEAQISCGVTLLKLSNGKVAFQTCHGNYVMAMSEENQWILTETNTLNECAQFTMKTLSGGEVSFQTCYGRYVTALNDAQAPEWVWMLKGQACDAGDWERFMLVP